MSDLNDLIHTNATIAYNQGVERERERIIKLLEDDERKFRAIAFGTAMDSYYSKWDAAVFEIQADYADDLQHRLKFGELDWADEADEADEEEDD